MHALASNMMIRLMWTQAMNSATKHQGYNLDLGYLDKTMFRNFFFAGNNVYKFETKRNIKELTCVSLKPKRSSHVSVKQKKSSHVVRASLLLNIGQMTSMA